MSSSCELIKADRHTKGFNLSNGQWARNGAPREGGRFLWRQIYNARKWGARIMYGAMWDEYDEGTQFLPAITKTVNLPQDESQKFTLIACDVDGYDVPPDWYMRIAGYGSSLVKSERHNEDRFPEKELRDWEPKYEVRPTLQSMLPSGSGSGSGSGSTSARERAHRHVPSRAPPDRDREDPPPPPYSREAERGAAVSTAVSRAPEPPVSTRPEIPRRDPLPPPPIPPRPNSQADPSPTSPHNPGAPPPISLASRPSGTPPHSPARPNRGPSPGAHHGQAPTPPHHLSANQPPPLESSYPHLMPMPQVPTRYQPDDTVGPNPFTSPAQLSMPQPGNPWYPPPPIQPAWSNQYWNNPSPTAPIHAPPGQPPGSYGYQSGYNDSVSFRQVEDMRASYSYPTPQTAPLLEPQQLHPGPPPPLNSSRESPLYTLCIGATVV